MRCNALRGEVFDDCGDILSKEFRLMLQRGRHDEQSSNAEEECQDVCTDCMCLSMRCEHAAARRESLILLCQDFVIPAA